MTVPVAILRARVYEWPDQIGRLARACMANEIRLNRQAIDEVQAATEAMRRPKPRRP